MTTRSPPEIEAPYFCRRCDRPLAEDGVKHVALGKSTAPMCLQCGGPAVPRVAPKTLPDGTPDTGSIVPHLMSSFGYVLRTDGLIAAAALGLATTFVGYVPVIGGAVATGLVLTYLFAIIQHTTRDDNDLPLPVDFVSWGDLMVPFFRFLTALGVASLPAIAGRMIRNGALSLPLQFLEAVLCLVSVGYLPAAVAQAALSTGWFGAVNPLPALSLIARIPKDYTVTVFVLAGLGCAGLVVASLAQLGARAMSVIPLFPHVAGGFASVIAPMIMARALGILLREHKHDLGLDT